MGLAFLNLRRFHVFECFRPRVPNWFGILSSADNAEFGISRKALWNCPVGDGAEFCALLTSDARKSNSPLTPIGSI